MQDLLPGPSTEPFNGGDSQRFRLEVCQEVQHRHSFGPLLESSKKNLLFCPSVSVLHTGFTELLCGTSCQLEGVPHSYHTLHKCVLTCGAKVTLEGVMKQPLKQTLPLASALNNEAH